MRFAIDSDDASCRIMHTGKDLEESRLAGAIFAAECMYRPGRHIKGDVLKCLHTWERLADVLNGQTT